MVTVMKKLVILAVGMVIACVPLRAQAATVYGSAVDGELGIATVVSAESIPVHACMVGISGLYFYSNDLLNTSGDINQRFDGNVHLTYGATEWLEVFLNESNSSQTITNNSAGRHNLYQVFGDLTGGLKMDWHIPYNIILGVDAFFQLNTRTASFGYQANATNFGVRLLGTRRFDWIPEMPFVLDINIGYTWDNSRYLLSGPDYTIGPYATVADLYASGLPNNEIEYALDVYHSNQVLGAVGLHVPFTYVTPFLQYYTNQFVSSSRPSLHYDQSPQFIVPGVRFTPYKQLAIDLGVELGLTKTETLPVIGFVGQTKQVRGVPLWTLLLGASYTFLPAMPSAPVQHEQMGEMTGTVTSTTGMPLAAVITISNATPSLVGTNPSTGVYLIHVPEGNHRITAVAQGFSGETIIVDVATHGKTTANFMLIRNETLPASTRNKQMKALAQVMHTMTITAQSIHFPVGSSRVSPVFYPALDELVRLLKDNPSIHILIQGNTDNSGSAALNQNLSQERATSVMNYLIQHGIASDRLKAKGYGEANPVEPNISQGARAINRRVTIQYTIQ